MQGVSGTLRGPQWTGWVGIYICMYVCVVVWGCLSVFLVVRCVKGTSLYVYKCLHGVQGVFGTLSGARRTGCVNVYVCICVCIPL